MKNRCLIIACCAGLLVVGRACAEVKPAALFSDHMVLQADMAVPVWGMADPGEAVAVTLNKQTKTTITAADGKWILRLSNLKAGGPFEMTIAGKNTVIVKDVLVGEVWLGSGQSNMQFPVSKEHASYAGLLNEAEEIASANYPQLRMFTGKSAKTYEPASELAGEWKICTPANVGDFSAVGYLFGRDLMKALNRPVGILTLAYGASTAEAWVPRDAIASDPLLRPMLDKFDARYNFYKSHPQAKSDEAPPAPQTLNARPGKPGPISDPVQDQHQPTVLFNGLIHPAIPYAIRGVIWYQGESIVGGSTGVELYPHVMETLVTQWRKLWNEGDFPFYVVQLAALKNVSNNPMVREQQAKILSLPKTGMAVTIDIGDPDNVHPKNKEPLGDRLSRIALANVYGRKIAFSGPIYRSMTMQDNAILLRFSKTEGGLVAKGGALKWFQIAGSDHHFVDAEAKIEGDTIVVSSPQVKDPVAVRYAWENYPEGCNLYNGAGLPAAPFRTDSWDALTNIAQQFTGK